MARSSERVAKIEARLAKEGRRIVIEVPAWINMASVRAFQEKPVGNVPAAAAPLLSSRLQNCPACGARVAAEADFCSQCGLRLPGIESAANATGGAGQ